MIKARTIIEIAGSPKEHVKKTMDFVMTELEKSKYEIFEKDIEPVSENKDLFSTFAEIEIGFGSPTQVYEFCFDFMPSSIDVLEPSKIEIEQENFSSSLNDLLATIHKLDMHLKNANAKVKIMQRNTNRLLANFIVLAIGEGEKTVEDISKTVGIPAEQLGNTIEAMVKDSMIKKEGDKFSR